MDTEGNILMKKYELGRLLGQGTFAKVYYARNMSTGQDGLLHTTCGTPAYVAPEVITRNGYDGDKADIWSCGVILFVLLAGYLPFQDSNLFEMYRKIGKSEFKFPHWFQPDVRKLLLRILDPNPVSRITMPKIKENPWFRNGKISKELSLDRSLGPSSTSTDHAENQDSMKPPNMNAFDIISLSPGFDLTALFQEPREKKEARFTIWQPASVILSKLEDLGKRLRMKVSKREAGLLKLEAIEEGRKGILSIDAEIFELTQSFHLVEVKKCNGDTLEYQNVIEHLRPGLQDIAWDEQVQREHQEVLPRQDK